MHAVNIHYHSAVQKNIKQTDDGFVTSTSDNHHKIAAFNHVMCTTTHVGIGSMHSVPCLFSSCHADVSGAMLTESFRFHIAACASVHMYLVKRLHDPC